MVVNIFLWQILFDTSKVEQHGIYEIHVTWTAMSLTRASQLSKHNCSNHAKQGTWQDVELAASLTRKKKFPNNVDRPGEADKSICIGHGYEMKGELVQGNHFDMQAG